MGVADEVQGGPRRLSAEAVVRTCCTCLVSVALGAAHGSTGAAIVEDQTTASVKVRTVDGRDVERDIRVALFLDSSAPRPRPLLVLNHGRAGSAADLAELRTSDYAGAARWLTRFGFIVALPVRVGYGETGEEGVRLTARNGAALRRTSPPDPSTHPTRRKCLASLHGMGQWRLSEVAKRAAPTASSIRRSDANRPVAPAAGNLRLAHRAVKIADRAGVPAYLASRATTKMNAAPTPVSPMSLTAVPGGAPECASGRMSETPM